MIRPGGCEISRKLMLQREVFSWQRLQRVSLDWLSVTGSLQHCRLGIPDLQPAAFFVCVFLGNTAGLGGLGGMRGINVMH